jgi:hypothetical protein
MHRLSGDVFIGAVVHGRDACLKNNKITDKRPKVLCPAAVTGHEADKNIFKIFLWNPKVLQKAVVKGMRLVKSVAFLPLGTGFCFKAWS